MWTFVEQAGGLTRRRAHRIEPSTKQRPAHSARPGAFTMNDNDITTLLREAASNVASPDYVNIALRRAQLARRRRRACGVGLAVASVAVAGAVAVQIRIADPISPTEPSPSPRSTTQTEPSPTPTATAARLVPAMAQPPWTNSRLSELGWVDVELPRTIPASATGLPTLTADPVHRAIAAAETDNSDGTGIVVLGEMTAPGASSMGLWSE